MRSWALWSTSAVFLMAAILGGCNRKEAATDTKAAAKVTILIDWKAEPTYAGFFVAKELGFYKDRGLDVDIVEGNGAATSAQVIGEGQTYFIGSCSGVATAIARSKGLPVTSVAVFYRNVPTVLYSLAQNPIRTPEDMIGKRIGLVEGSINVDEYRAVVAANNLDRAAITEVGVGWEVAPLLTGQVDGLVDYEEMTPVQLRLDGHDIAVLRFAEHGIQAYSLNLVVNDAWLRDHADLAAAVREATIKGYELVREKPEEAAEIFSRLFPERKKEYVQESMKIVAQLLGKGDIGQQTRAGWSDTVRTLDELGLLARPVTVQEVAAEKYLTP